MKKIIGRVGLILIILLGLFIIGYKDVFFQEGKPLPLVKGIGKMMVTGKPIVQYAENPDKYIMKFDNGYVPLKQFMKEKGWEYQEQVGSGFVFRKGNENTTITTRWYTKKFLLIYLNESIE